MTEKFAKLMVGLFGTWTSTLYGKYIIVFILSMIPILELRGGLIAASILNLPMWQSLLICFIGNLIPVPLILWFIMPLFERLKKRKFLKSFVTKIEKKANNKKDQIERLKYIGLFFFVGVPLPGTGAWTGSLIAAFLGLDKKKSLIATSLGVLMAGIIMLLVSYGVLGNLIR